VFEEQAWKDISFSCISLVFAMLQKDPSKRPSIEKCLTHTWFLEQQAMTEHVDCDELKKVLCNIRSFHTKKRLQVETLQFLANQTQSSEFDFKLLRGAFRDLDLN